VRLAFLNLAGGWNHRSKGGDSQANRDRWAELFFSYSYPFDILAPAPQSGFARPLLASTAPLWLLNSLTWGQDNPEPNAGGPAGRDAI
jgi:hypothetical protein